jgi:hypothetical protein
MKQSTKFMGRPRSPDAMDHGPKHGRRSAEGSRIDVTETMGRIDKKVNQLTSLFKQSNPFELRLRSAVRIQSIVRGFIVRVRHANFKRGLKEWKWVRCRPVVTLLDILLANQDRLTDGYVHLKQRMERRIKFTVYRGWYKISYRTTFRRRQIKKTIEENLYNKKMYLIRTVFNHLKSVCVGNLSRKHANNERKIKMEAIRMEMRAKVMLRIQQEQLRQQQAQQHQMIQQQVRMGMMKADAAAALASSIDQESDEELNRPESRASDMSSDWESSKNPSRTGSRPGSRPASSSAKHLSQRPGVASSSGDGVMVAGTRSPSPAGTSRPSSSRPGSSKGPGGKKKEKEVVIKIDEDEVLRVFNKQVCAQFLAQKQVALIRRTFGGFVKLRLMSIKFARDANLKWLRVRGGKCFQAWRDYIQMICVGINKKVFDGPRTFVVCSSRDYSAFGLDEIDCLDVVCRWGSIYIAWKPIADAAPFSTCGGPGSSCIEHKWESPVWFNVS